MCRHGGIGIIYAFQVVAYFQEPYHIHLHRIHVRGVAISHMMLCAKPFVFGVFPRHVMWKISFDMMYIYVQV